LCRKSRFAESRYLYELKAENGTKPTSVSGKIERMRVKISWHEIKIQ